ncbi:rhomboid family intramembrane serine protease [Algibacillus agarilyticus]|uniref:rhomboid family intramembrane serine protease n=1 Tax=Algibacillus agarilyticus TaxID=2234133 RepID=UPI0013007541|nr:rhomboid family intramembrane serine protease [Algibacillus agarilyticus]
MRFYVPVFTLLLCLLIFCISSFVAFEVHGSIFSKVKMLVLKQYGGVTYQQLGQFEFWRLFTSQLVHSKPIHMLFNVVSLLFIGYFVEKQIGGKNFITLFFVSGIIGTLASVLPVPAPYDIGTGASQAVFGIIACGVVVMVKGVNHSIWLKCALLFCIIPAMTLDFIYAGYPKVGHLVGFATGLAMSLYWLPPFKLSNVQKINR